MAHIRRYLEKEKGEQIESSSSEQSSSNLLPQVHAIECRDYFDRYLNHLKESEEVADDAEAIRVSILCAPMKDVGMADDVEEDELEEILISSGHADVHGNMDYDQFVVFATDFKFVESVVDYKNSLRETQRNSSGINLIEAELDGGPLEAFFNFLTIGASLGFSITDFVEAFEILEMKLSTVDADSLVRYGRYIRSSFSRLNFVNFLNALRRADERTKQARNRGRTTFLDKGQCLHRMMDFVASYITRGPRRRSRYYRPYHMKNPGVVRKSTLKRKRKRKRSS